MSLYLKYRPRTFKNIVWQYFIKETLLKAISKDKLVWSYLFSWPKWTWKTSVARILAQWVNCQNYINDLCLKCNTCKETLNWQNADIIEIDAASNSSVENIKQTIIKWSQYWPNSNHKYKVYIIDEVHMLSKSAFNALLKIMEEPPKYIIFILATTEIEKIPDTIISRCQVYNFKTINKDDIIWRLEYICKEENIRFDEKWLNYIYNISEWSMRNAIKYLEQYSVEWNIYWEVLENKLGLVWEESIKLLLKHLYLAKKEDYKKVISIYDEIINSGKDIKLFLRNTCFYLRDKIIDEYKKDTPNSEFIKIYSYMMWEFENCIKQLHWAIDWNVTLLVTLSKIISRNIKN